MNNGPIIRIKKIRFLRKFIFEDDTFRSTEWINIEKNEGLQCEITEIINGSTSWWSIGFEYIGMNNNHVKFLNAVKKILVNFSSELNNKNSMGYPEWINKNSDILEKGK